jgi:hypothetical protein
MAPTRFRVRDRVSLRKELFRHSPCRSGVHSIARTSAELGRSLSMQAAAILAAVLLLVSAGGPAGRAASEDAGWRSDAVTGDATSLRSAPAPRAAIESRSFRRTSPPVALPLAATAPVSAGHGAPSAVATTSYDARIHAAFAARGYDATAPPTAS